MYKKEVALQFSYPYERIIEARNLKKILDSKEIKVLFYESDGYWNHKFIVRRSGYTWNEIMKIINSVYAPSDYKKMTMWFDNNSKRVIL